MSDLPTGIPTLVTVERWYIRRVLDAVKGNKAQAARLLGIDRRTLYRRLKEPHATIAVVDLTKAMLDLGANP